MSEKGEREREWGVIERGEGEDGVLVRVSGVIERENRVRERERERVG